MTPRLLLALLILPAGGYAQQRSGKAPRPTIPVVVELFTSEGCSSCPAADDLLARLDTRGRIPRNIEIIALGEHVDYWDNLGWKDSFSSPLFSTRQQDYGIAFHNSTVYTPQAVINGHKEVLGSDSQALLRAVTEASYLPRAEVEMRLASPDTVQLHVGRLPVGSNKSDVLLAIAESGIETDVKAGENNGRRLKHTAVVRMMSKLAELDPAHPGEYQAEARLNLRPEWQRANMKLVLLVQDRETRRIWGAASAWLEAKAPGSRARPESRGRGVLTRTR
jgi:hypothetical protein